MDEFDIIHRFFAPLTRGNPGAFALGDDAAILPTRPGYEHVVTTDAIVAGVHFLNNESPDNIAVRLCACNLSDLAAMGAKPLGFTLACAWSRNTDIETISSFTNGLGQFVDRYDFPLLGGDTVTTDGPMMFSLTAIGEVATGKALRRNAAKPGDSVYVSGTIGDGALGLMAAQEKLQGLSPSDLDFLANRYRRPTPRVATGLALAGRANACIDISDGLLQDLGHICEQSSVSMRIESAKIPLSPAARAAIAFDPAQIEIIVSGGDDYELAFTGSSIEAIADVPITLIGEVIEGAGEVSLIDEAGQPVFMGKRGYNHFSGS